MKDGFYTVRITNDQPPKDCVSNITDWFEVVDDIVIIPKEFADLGYVLDYIYKNEYEGYD